MAKTVRDSNLETRTARARLSPGKMHFRSLDVGLHVGYRRGRAGGKWLARYYLGTRLYRHEGLGMADDVLDADGVIILNFSQAQEAARKIYIERKRTLAGLREAKAGPYTVKDCMTDYLAWLEIHRKSAQDIRYKSDAFIIPVLGSLDCTKLTSAKIQAWLEELASRSPRTRTKLGADQNFRAATTEAEGQRRRRATANRVLTNLKAALNRAWREGSVLNDDPWRRVKPFKGVDAARLRYLTLAEAKRLINASSPDFRILVQGALATGARYGELCSLAVEDFNPDSGTLHIRQSKSGKGRHIVLAKEGLAFFASISAGRESTAPMFKKENGSKWGASHQMRPMGDAVRAGKLGHATFHCIRHTYASHAIMNGAPLLVVAKNLGHSDTRMVEKHYGHLAPSYIAEAIRAAVPTFGFKSDNIRTVQTA